LASGKDFYVRSTYINNQHIHADRFPFSERATLLAYHSSLSWSRPAYQSEPL
jgi:hypothetical protein